MAKRRSTKTIRKTTARSANSKSRSTTTAKKAKKSQASSQQRAAATRKANAKKRAKELARSQAAEATAATTIHYAPPPVETVADPSKAPGHQHRQPPMSLQGVKHSTAYVAKARTPFNRRMNIGR